jgi:hypothetical protein
MVADISEFLGADGQLLPGNRTGLMVTATMLFPKDKELRRACHAQLLIGELCREQPGASIPVATACLPILHADKLTTKALGKRQDRGVRVPVMDAPAAREVCARRVPVRAQGETPRHGSLGSSARQRG